MKVFMLWAKGDNNDAPYLLDAVDEYSLEEWSSEDEFWNRPNGPLVGHDQTNNPVRVTSVEIADEQLFILFSALHLGRVQMQQEQEPTV